MTDPHVSARIDPEDYQRIEHLVDVYELDKSKLIRLCIRNGLRKVEDGGIDALVDAGAAEDPPTQ